MALEDWPGRRSAGTVRVDEALAFRAGREAILCARRVGTRLILALGFDVVRDCKERAVGYLWYLAFSVGELEISGYIGQQH